MVLLHPNKGLALASLLMVPPVARGGLPASPTDCGAGLIISEVMYDPPSPLDDRNGEWVEIVNFGCEPVDVSEYTITDDSGNIPDPLTLLEGASSILQPGEYAIIVDGQENSKVPSQGFADGLTIFTTDDFAIGNGLRNSGDSVLLGKDGVTVDSVDYAGSCANGLAGFSIERQDPFGPGDCSNFVQSDLSGGTPGLLNSNWIGTDPGECPEVCDDGDGKNGGMFDDPHIKTWGGSWFDYHGECDLVLIHAPFFDGINTLDIHVRTQIRYNTYSFITSAAIAVNTSVLEVASYGTYMVDGVQNAALDEGINLAAKYPILHSQPNEKQHIFTVVVSPHENITLSTFKDMVSVKISGGSDAHYKNSVGIMGSFDGNMLGRDGTQLDFKNNANDVGQEWQVRDDEAMLFMTTREPQYPKPCILPDKNAVVDKEKQRRRLGQADVSQQAAEEACSHFPFQEQKDACIFDVLATNDLDIAWAGTY